MRRAVLLALILTAGCLHRPSQPQAPQEAWAVYEDDFIRFQHPPNYFVGRATDTVQKVWMAGLPNEYTPGIPDIIGGIGVSGYYDGSVKRPLKDFFTPPVWESHRFTSSLKAVSPKNAECLMLTGEGGSIMGCVGGKQAADCVQAHLDMHCYDGAMNYFSVSSTLGSYPRASPPPKSVQENLAVVERILGSLEFK
ncbi:MAG: hypothetical protein WC728_06795 [Elusimicrobiota bacterium]